MKKFMTFLTMITLVGCLVFTTSCKKKNDDPTPSTPTTNGGSSDSVAVTVTTTGTLVAPANVDINATISNLVADSISKVELIDASNNVIATLTTSPFSFSRTGLTAGTYNYIVKLTATNGTTKTQAVTFTVVAPNGAPIFTSTDLGQLTSSTTTYNTNISSVVSDPENDVVTVTNVTTTANGVTVTNVSGTSFSINVPNTQYAGQITLSVTISDGTNSTTSNMTVKIGTTAQATTYGIMSNFFGSFTASNPSGLIFSSNGNVVTGVSNSNFWGTGTCKSGTWVINSNGTLTITSSCGISTFDVTSSGNVLYLNNTYSYGTGVPFGGTK